MLFVKIKDINKDKDNYGKSWWNYIPDINMLMFP